MPYSTGPQIEGQNGAVTLAADRCALLEFGGLYPGYVSEAHHGVTYPGYGHPFLKPGNCGRRTSMRLLMVQQLSHQLYAACTRARCCSVTP